MHSLGDVWHLGSEDLESLQVLGPCYLSAFLRSRLWGILGVHSVTLQGSVSGGFAVLCRVLGPCCSAFLWAVSLGSQDLLQGSGISAGSGSLLCSGGSGVSGAQCHLLHSFFLSLCIP